eukprot:Awhi_evm1s12776
MKAASIFLVLCASQGLKAAEYTIGSFEVNVISTGAFTVTRNGRVLFAPSSELPILTAYTGNETVVQPHGNLKIQDAVVSTCGSEIELVSEQFSEDTKSVELQYTFPGCDDVTATMSLLTDSVDSTHLIFDIKLIGESNRVSLNYQSHADQKIYGLGVQYSRSNMKGASVYNIVREKGAGRGIQPLTVLLDAVKKGAGGTWDQTYTPANYYLTDDLTSIMLENTEFVNMNFTSNVTTSIEVFSKSVRGHILYGETHKDIIESYTEYAGRMAVLPDWISEKAILGTQGGTDVVSKQVEEALASGAALGSIWIQDFCGKRQTDLGSRLVWHWEVDQIQYPNWDGFVEDLNSKNISTMTYINPFLTNSTNDLVDSGHYTRDLYKEAEAGGYFVKDLNNNTINLDQDGFFAALIDFTNPDAWAWYKDSVMKKNLVDHGMRGWMADFGEQFPYDNVQLYDGSDPKAYHNKYPVEWARMNHELAQELNRTGDLTYFMRAGFTQTPKYSTLMWLGDQLVTWDEMNGMKTAVIGMIGAGLSGFSLEHSDIGGYVAIDTPPLLFIRSKELFNRWCELAAFTSAYRTHEGTLPDKNWQFNSDEETLQHWALFSNVFQALHFYRKELMVEAEEKGYPLARAMFLEFPEDPVAYDLNLQYMFGSELLVAPVMDDNVTVVEVYLPQGDWTHIWSQETFVGPQTLNITAPMGTPAVFHIATSTAGLKFASNLREKNIIV